MAYLALAYEFFLSGDVIKALKTLSQGERRFKSHADNEHIHALSPAFTHVWYATEAAIKLQKGDVDEATRVSVYFLISNL